MSMDSVGDFLTSIRNAGMARHETVDVTSSKLKEAVAKVLKENGYIRGFKVAKESSISLMRVYLRYDNKGRHIIRKVSRVSKPSRPVYVDSKSLTKVRAGFGIAILSTNKGVVSNEQAALQNVGGEVLCQVW